MHPWKQLQFINIVLFAGWILSISALLAHMNEVEIKQLNQYK